MDYVYTVRGNWPFPTDMLRHDGSRAVSVPDQIAILSLSTEHATDLRAFDDHAIKLTGPNRPNYERWQSFGWGVVSSNDNHFFMYQSAAREKAKPISFITNVLLQGDPMLPISTDLIVQTGQLKVGKPVPEGWRVLTGNQSESLVARVAYRYEIEED